MLTSLRAQVRLVLAIAAILPALTVGGLAMYRARTDVETEVIRGQLAHVRAVASSLDQTLQGARRSLELAAAWWADERQLDQADSPESKRVLNRLWRRLHREVPVFIDLSIVDVQGDTIFGKPPAVTGDLGAHSFGGYIGDVVFDQGRPYVPVVTQARSRTGERIGVFIARLDLSFVAETIGDARLGNNARLVVIDGQGAAIARSDGGEIDGKSNTGLNERVVALALGRLREGKLVDADKLSIYRNLVAFQSRRAVPWALVFEQPQRDAFALAYDAARDTVIVAILVLAMAILGGAALAARLTKPLRGLAKRADDIAEGHIENGHAPPISAPGEIGILATRLEEMAERIGERERLHAALAHEDRLVTVGTMAASVAHEINNPLTTIVGYSNYLLEDKDEEHPDRSGLQLIAEEAARMKNIVGTMLDYSRTESPKRGPADLVATLQRMSSLMLPALKKLKVSLNLSLPAPLPPVRAGDQQLQQIFVNLVQNAAQAMPEGGDVTITVEHDGAEIIVVVSDQGPGIPVEDRNRVFETFYTTKAAGTGTGLGLAVVKHLVSEFRGRIEITDCEKGDGACIKVVIPVSEEDERST